MFHAEEKWMAKKETRGILLLLLTALIWGCAFVAQSVGAETIEPFTFQAVRSLIGGAVLLPAVVFKTKKKARANNGFPYSAKQAKTLILGSLICGVILCAASCLQQTGIAFTTVGKAGFITSMYILIVPILGLFFGQKVPVKIWGCILLAAAGLFLLCMTKELRLSRGDALMALCALLFAAHILAVDYFSPRTEGLILACLQFFVSAITAGAGMLLWEHPCWEAVFSAWPALLYAGGLSCGIGYTLQILGQKTCRPAIASLIMSLESVFSLLAGTVLLGEIPTIKEIAGCALMFIAIVLAQLPSRKKQFYNSKIS